MNIAFKNSISFLETKQICLLLLITQLFLWTALPLSGKQLIRSTAYANRESVYAGHGKKYPSGQPRIQLLPS